MRLKLDSESKIVGYVIVGANPDYKVEVEQSILPAGFFDDFAPDKYVLVNGNIIKNPDYVAPVKPDDVPTTEQLMINQLGLQVAVLAAKIDKIEGSDVNA